MFLKGKYELAFSHVFFLWEFKTRPSFMNLPCMHPFVTLLKLFEKALMTHTLEHLMQKIDIQDLSLQLGARQIHILKKLRRTTRKFQFLFEKVFFFLHSTVSFIINLPPLHQSSFRLSGLFTTCVRFRFGTKISSMREHV